MNSGPKGGYRAYMGWGMWGKCAPGHPRSLEWCGKPPCHRSIHAVLHPVRRRCVHWMSILSEQKVSGSPHHPTAMHLAQL